MLWKKLFKRTLPENLILKSDSKAHQILPVQLDGDLHRVLEHERSRAGSELSLLLFECCSSFSETVRRQKLWEVISPYMRTTDKVGWTSDGRLGVLLPETPLAAARKIAEEIGRLCEAALPDFSYKIYTYQPHSGAGEIEEILKAIN